MHAEAVLSKLSQGLGVLQCREQSIALNLSNVN